MLNPKPVTLDPAPCTLNS